MPYTSNLRELPPRQKEHIFLGVLKSRLLLAGYVAAVPEPDVGDDLWVADPKATMPQVYRCQIKSAYSWSVLKRKQLRRYLVNIDIGSFEKTLDQAYVYFIGLYDESVPGRFHIGCFPSRFFSQFWHDRRLRCTRVGTVRKLRGRKRRPGRGEPKRVLLDFFVSGAGSEAGSCNYYFNYNDEEPVDGNFDGQFEILRSADGLP